VRCAVLAMLALYTVLLAPRASWGQAEPRELAAIPPMGRVDYDVIRRGETIGTHSVLFQHQGRLLKIATQTDIEVELLGLTLYRFHYRAEEEWLDGRLMRLISRTNDDGEMLTANLARDGNQIRGTCNGTVLSLSAEILPISTWHPDFVRQSVVLDQYECAIRSITSVDDGIEPISIGKQKIAARHYAISGELQRDIWYGPDGQTALVGLPTSDGSEIAFVIRLQPAPQFVSK
jgi:Family of unknown function (DUF6134)